MVFRLRSNQTPTVRLKSHDPNQRVRNSCRKVVTFELSKLIQAPLQSDLGGGKPAGNDNRKYEL
ncbi:MAG: hypothetical protein JWP89_842 [Schlesneria sp.]|nr:hypothetical protein [Schlesneria sp.]